MQIAAVWNAGYFPYYAPPGVLRLAVKPWRATDAEPAVTLNLEAGHVYYVKGTIASGWKSPHFGLEIVDPQKAHGQIRQCRLLPDASGTDAETLRRAQAGDVWSQIELADLYSHGARYAAAPELLPDDVEAYKWLTIAATDKVARDLALRSRAGIAARMTGERIADAERRARAWIDAPENQPP